MPFSLSESGPRQTRPGDSGSPPVHSPSRSGRQSPGSTVNRFSRSRRSVPPVWLSPRERSGMAMPIDDHRRFLHLSPSPAAGSLRLVLLLRPRWPLARSLGLRLALRMSVGRGLRVHPIRHRLLLSAGSAFPRACHRSASPTNRAALQGLRGPLPPRSCQRH
jgi:hypothetical protein